MIKNTLNLYSSHTKNIYINTKNFFKPDYLVKLAETKSEVKKAQKLRYEVFFSDRNKKKIFNISNFRRDSDKYDSYCDHIIVSYKKSKFAKSKTVGTYRLLKQKIAEQKIGFYSSEEYDLAST